MAYVITGKDCMISEWILLVLSYVFVAARVYTRLFRLREKLRWSDWLLIVSAIDALGLIICDTLTYDMGVMDSWAPSVALSKISFSSNYFYDVGMGFPKLSMLAFYWEYFHHDISSATRKVLIGMTAFVVACYTAILFDDTFFCGSDVSVQWSQEEGACNVFWAPEPFIVNFTLNLACYLIVYAIPVMFLVQGLLRPSTGLWVAFALGTLTIAATVVRFATLKAHVGPENLVYPMSIIEMTLAIIVVSLPGLKPLIRRGPKSQTSDEPIEVQHHHHDHK